MTIKVLIVDNVRGPSVGKRWRVENGFLCEAEAGQEDFVVLKAPDEATSYTQATAKWLATWHEGCRPSGFIGRRFSHDSSDPVWSQGLRILMDAAENPRVNVGSAFKRLAFCLQDAESTFVLKAIEVLNAFYQDVIGKSILDHLDSKMPSSREALCEAIELVPESNTLKSAIERECRRYQALDNEENALQMLCEFRDFLLGDDGGAVGIVQKIRTLALAD